MGVDLWEVSHIIILSNSERERNESLELRV